MKSTMSQSKNVRDKKSVRYAAIGARVLLGLIFFVFGFGYFFMPEPPIDPATPGGAYFTALLATGFFFPFLKIVEGCCGFMLFFKRWTPLSLLILAPIVIQIFLYSAFLDPTPLIMSIIMIVFVAFLAWFHWEKYEGLFRA